MTTIWDPYDMGPIHLKHRLALAPMTRSRANADGTPGPLAADYYRQRAGLGLLITEGAQPSDDGQGYLNTPGIYTDAHVEGWKAVADAVHEEGARLIIQLMHVGRMSHPDNTPHHRQPVAPSAIAPGVPMFTATGMQDIPVPRSLGTDEIALTVDDFRQAALAAVAAGADGVEIHGANGYLLHQFLAPNANARDDWYGGSIENRSRLTLQVATAVADAIGPERTGIRLSPGATIGGLDEGPESDDLYRHLVAELAQLDLLYLHLFHFSSEALLEDLRALWPGTLLVIRSGRQVEQLGDDVARGLADLAPVGVAALANPDLVDRLSSGAPLNTPDPSTFYGGGAAGYTDYPTAASVNT
ncbi:1,2-oxophytodienoate reductase [Mycobacteroides immunogenum]|uniref:1,2-oxophytodienoate reductase n=1 Tax=Mycobacteroides immunogenum TaxID=83262 RepID=A0A179VCK1_9MYCO|nr:alkene reductase [Mycobacteroides immunogenum]OAT68016.1 1,2-oxophytodienoate reductase [Mycobacteroides immunogenum]